MFENPYADVDWVGVERLHSVSHLHSDHVPGAAQQVHQMGIHHHMFSEYYPSQPLHHDPAQPVANCPGAIISPNAEHHSLTNHALHFCAIGSHYTTGYGQRVVIESSESPARASFGPVRPFAYDHPWQGVYRLDLQMRAVRDSIAPIAKVSVQGALACRPRAFDLIGNGRIDQHLLQGEKVSIWLRATEKHVHVQMAFDRDTTQIDCLRLMQGVNRPWQDAFAAALDGTACDAHGRPIEGLLFDDAGGLCINHPAEACSQAYLQMLDYDPRVLGVEVWNHRRGFGLVTDQQAARYYDHWDAILRTGRRCWGFFAKDHRIHGQGRNVLLLPPSAGKSPVQRAQDALRAYRAGRFFGLLGAMHVNEAGRATCPYDHSDFRFARIETDARSATVRVELAGNDPDRRPNLQIRFITDAGIAHVVNHQAHAIFHVPRHSDGRPACRYIRIEALAYPKYHLGNRLLHADQIAAMHVAEIVRLHDRVGCATDNDLDPSGQAPVPIVDLIFSQPIRIPGVRQPAGDAD